MIETAIVILVLLSLIFSILGVAGLFRFPDFYTRIHAAGLVGSFGLGHANNVYACLYNCLNVFLTGEAAWFNYGAHVLLALAVVVVTATTSTHAIARSAYRSGNMPKDASIDALAEDEPKMRAQEEARK